MKKSLLVSQWVAVILALFPVFSVAAVSPEEGKEYLRIANAVQQNPVVLQNSREDMIVITEFFSYGCPACNSVAQRLSDWQHLQGKNIKVQRVPVEFFKGWDLYARAFYTAEYLGVLEDMDLKIFNAIHKQQLDLSNKMSMRKFFIDQGVQAEDFDKTFNSFAVDRSLEHGKMLMRSYRVYAVPTVVIDNVYQTDLEKAQGPQGFITVLDYLVNKIKTDNTEEA